MLSFICAPKMSNSVRQNNIIESLGIPTKKVELRRGIWCRWEPPSALGMTEGKGERKRAMELVI